VREQIAAALAQLTPVERPLGDLRPSAVMLLLHGPAGDERVVFQVRTTTVRHHKGEISLPGGRRDETDASFLHTALRETHEEVGIPPDAVQVLGALDDVETFGSRHLIRPYVGLVAEGVEPSITALREVQELLHVPLAHLLSPQARVWKVVDRDGRPEPTPAFDYEGHLIWGATARVVTQFVDLCATGGVRDGREGGADRTRA
jgi:8-oxo-dGTP pyrophosphatase MutT (NUDIX family)